MRTARDVPTPLADSLVMAMTLLLFTPSSGGLTAVERLLKQRDALKPEEAIAAAALRQVRFRLLRVEDDAGGGENWLRDLASGERLRVDGEAALRGLAGPHMVARLVPYGRDRAADRPRHTAGVAA